MLELIKNRPFQKRVWSCITLSIAGFTLDTVDPAMGMMLMQFHACF